MRISKSFRRVGPSLLVLSAAWASACSSSDSKKGTSNQNTGGSGNDKPDATVGSSNADWTMMGYDNANTYWNRAETKISVDSVKKLTQAWVFDKGGGVTSTPVITDGKAYILTTGLFAVDLATGNELWSNTAPDLQGYASLAYADHVIYVHDTTGVLHAMSDSDGSELWKVTTDDQAGLVGFSSPILTKDYVIIGGSTLEEVAPPKGGATFRGFIEAFNKDGTVAWKKYTVDAPAHGATLWSSVSVDEAGGFVFAATGNNHGAPITDTSDAFLAIDLANVDADFKWKQQILTGDGWMLVGGAPGSPDADFGSNPIVFDYNGKQLIAGGNKGGDFWVLDRAAGTVIKHRNLGPGSSFKGGTFITGAFDGKHLLTANNGSTSTGSGSVQAATGKEVTLYAMDPETLDIVWEREVEGPVYSTITIANGVGFVGRDKTLQAFNTDTGEVLFEQTTEATIATSPAVSNGYVIFGSGMSWTNTTPGTKIYALKTP